MKISKGLNDIQACSVCINMFFRRIAARIAFAPLILQIIGVEYHSTKAKNTVSY